MDGGNGSSTHFLAVSMAMLFALLLLSPLSLASEANTPANETITDGRITGFQSDLSQDYLRQWNMSEGEWFSISLNCNQCEAQVTIDGITTTTTSVWTKEVTRLRTLRARFKRERVTNFSKTSLDEQVGGLSVRQ